MVFVYKFFGYFLYTILYFIIDVEAMRRDHHPRFDEYNTLKSYCCDHYIYSPGERLYQNYCKSFRCPICRRNLVKTKLKDVVKVATQHKLFSHFVITLPGTKFRRYVNPDQSFKYITRKWHNFADRYYRKFKVRLSYILFNRSTSSGYAHLHILTQFIPIDWITSVIPKLCLGFFNISYVQVHRLKNYLSKYWYKEHEWYIPKNKRHFSTSRNIRLTERFRKEVLYPWISVSKKIKFEMVQYYLFCTYNYSPVDWYQWQVDI